MSLGIEAESNGRLWCGDRVKIRLRIARNLFLLAKVKKGLLDDGMPRSHIDVIQTDLTVLGSSEDEVERIIEKSCSPMTLNSGCIRTIPTRVWSLKPLSPIDCVIVTEHANLATELNLLEDNFDGVHIVMAS